MRILIVAASLLGSTVQAGAQVVVAPPSAPAPPAAAPFEERATWCDAYATWFVEVTETAQRGTPADIRATQRIEVELNACKLDPQDYERDTRAEADAAVEIAQG